MPTAEEILATFPGFEPELPSQAIYLSLADKRTADVITWNDDDDLRALAVALLTAHSMVRAGIIEPSGLNGEVRSETMGPSSITYADLAAISGDDDLSATTFGLQLIQLRKDFIFAARTSLG